MTSDDTERLVPACPGWRVRDVVAHLVGIIEDANAQRLQGRPNDDQSAEQVRRHADEPFDLVLASWNDLAPEFEEMLSPFGVWNAVFDVVIHEHDIRYALGRPGARATDTIRFLAPRLVGSVRLPVPLTAHFPDGSTATSRPLKPPVEGEPVPEPGAPITLRATPFDVLRACIGRRTVDEIRTLDWSTDPTDLLLDQLVMFTPPSAPVDID